MQYRVLIIWLLLCFSVLKVEAQCQLGVEVKEDLKICSSDLGTLDAFVTGIPLHVEWTPTIGLNNPLSLHPTIKTPIDTTYTIKVKGFNEADNLLNNSDFSEGYTGFTSQYEAESTKLGGYIIGKIDTDLFSEAEICKDHSTPEGGGDMFMTRVSTTANVDTLSLHDALPI